MTYVPIVEGVPLNSTYSILVSINLHVDKKNFSYFLTWEQACSFISDTVAYLMISFMPIIHINKKTNLA